MSSVSSCLGCRFGDERRPPPAARRPAAAQSARRSRWHQRCRSKSLTRRRCGLAASRRAANASRRSLRREPARRAAAAPRSKSARHQCRAKALGAATIRPEFEGSHRIVAVVSCPFCGRLTFFYGLWPIVADTASQDEAPLRLSDIPEEECIMSEVVLSSAVRSNLLNLQSTAELLGKTQERLATGLRGQQRPRQPDQLLHRVFAEQPRCRPRPPARLGVERGADRSPPPTRASRAITKLVESAQATARQALQTTATDVHASLARRQSPRILVPPTLPRSALAVGDDATAITITDRSAPRLTATYTDRGGW